MEKRYCQRCKKEFLIKPSDIRKGGGKHCSRACYNATRSATRGDLRRCSHCKEWKSISEYWMRHGRQMLQSKCKQCATLTSLPGRRKYARSEKGKIASKKYWTGDAGRAASERARRKRVENGKQALALQLWRKSNLSHAREVGAAHEAVRRAVLAGRLIKPSICSQCKAPGIIHAHHHLGYKKENYLDIAWLCIACHERAHHRI